MSIIDSSTINIASTVRYGMAKFNLKDYKFYSKNNPYMLYCKERSYCNLCKKSFKGKSGAQSHSSKIHHITLDGKKLKQYDNFEQKVLSDINQNSETIPVEIKPDEHDHSIMSDMKKIDDKINLNFKINQLESQGLYTQANEIREKFDLHKVVQPEEPSNNTSDDMMQNMLNMMYFSESDTSRKNKIFELIMMKSEGISDDIIMMGLMSLPLLESQKSESSDLMTLLLIPLLQKMNKNENKACVLLSSMLSSL